MKRVLVLLVVVALVLGVMVLGAGAAFAGEVTGKGKATGAPAHANSICAFSGQNDGNPPPGRTQSFGQDVKFGRADPKVFNPGDACRGGSNPQNPPGGGG
jgi:hypothetical protein